MDKIEIIDNTDNNRFKIISKFTTELVRNQKLPPIDFEITFKKNMKELFSLGEMDIG